MAHRDTIAAVATPPGVGGVGLIRVSGPQVGEIAHRLFRSAHGLTTFRSHRLYHGHIISPETGDPIDEVLISFMEKPRSYTGEDTLEISCHGGILILEAVLGEVIKAGASLAEPGEFTRRAFLNNRIDLSQAEAVADLIMAKTAKGLKIALAQLRGDLARRIEALRSAILDILASLDAVVDFSEDEGSNIEEPRIINEISSVINEVNSLISTYHQAAVYRRGLQTVIAGRPNVGKSSLLNSLIGWKRAIVTPIPGTTRDFIEEYFEIGGIPIRLVDTAGIRQPENVIEEEGIRQVWEKLDTADVVLVVLDGSEPLTPADKEIIAANKGKTIIPLINKSDLPLRLDEEVLRDLLPDTAAETLSISAKYGKGIPELIDVISRVAAGEPGEDSSEVMITNIRHKAALERTASLLAQARESIADGLPAEFAAFDAREALDSLSEIYGTTAGDDVLDRIFTRFCIGK